MFSFSNFSIHISFQNQFQPPANLPVAIPPPLDLDRNSPVPRFLTFSPPPTNLVDINVTSRDPVSEVPMLSHEEALRTIQRRNYPKVLPDIEKRRSMPPSANPANNHSSPATGRRLPIPPSPPPRMFGPSRSLECIEDNDATDGINNDINSATSNLHVGQLTRRGVDSMDKNRSDPSLADKTSFSMCPVHGSTKTEIVQPARSEPRIVITPILEKKSSNMVRKISSRVFDENSF